MDTRSFSLGRRRQRHHLEICFVRGSNSRVYGRVDFRDPPSHTTSSVRDCCQLLLLWKLICLICYGSWRPHGKAFLRRIYLLYTNSHRQLLLISNRLWAFLLLEWPFPRRILLKGLEPLRINWKGSDNGRHAKPALVEVGPIEVGTIRSLSQSANSQSDKHNKASPTTTYSFNGFPLFLLPFWLGAGEGLKKAKEGFWDWACISTSVLDGSYINKDTL